MKTSEIVVCYADEGMTPAFVMCFYGLGPDDLGISGTPVRKALKKRGLDPDKFVTSPFHILKVTR